MTFRKADDFARNRSVEAANALLTPASAAFAMPAAIASQGESTTWSNNQLAAALMIRPQRITQLVKTGVLPTSPQGKHDPFLAVPAYISFLGRRLTGGDLKSADCRGTIPVLNSRGVRDNLLNVPDRVSAQCASLRDQNQDSPLVNSGN